MNPARATDHPIKRTPTICVPWVVVGELHYGALRSKRPEAELLSVDDVAEEYGRIKAELAQIGKPIPDNDI